MIWSLAAPALPRASAPGLLARFGWVAAENAAELAGAIGVDGPAQVGARLAAGRRCCAAWTDGQLAAWGWVSYGAEQVGETTAAAKH